MNMWRQCDKSFLFMARLIMLLQRISVYEWKNSQSNVNYLIRYSIKVNSFNLILWFFLHRGTIDLCINDLCTNVAFKCDICDEIFKKGVHLHALIWPFTNKARFCKCQSSISLDFPHTWQMFFLWFQWFEPNLDCTMYGEDRISGPPLHFAAGIWHFENSILAAFFMLIIWIQCDIHMW